MTAPIPPERLPEQSNTLAVQTHFPIEAWHDEPVMQEIRHQLFIHAEEIAATRSRIPDVMINEGVLFVKLIVNPFADDGSLMDVPCKEEDAEIVVIRQAWGTRRTTDNSG